MYLNCCCMTSPFQDFTRINQKYLTLKEGVDYLTEWNELISVLKGEAATKTEQYNDSPRYVMTGRDLASVIRDSTSFEIWKNAYYVLKNTLKVPYNSGLPKVSCEDLITSHGGPIEALRMLADVTNLAAANCYYYKWNYGVARPEAYGKEITTARLSTIVPVTMSGCSTTRSWKMSRQSMEPTCCPRLTLEGLRLLLVIPVLLLP